MQQLKHTFVSLFIYSIPESEHIRLCLFSSLMPYLLVGFDDYDKIKTILGVLGNWKILKTLSGRKTCVGTRYKEGIMAGVIKR